MNNNNNYNNNNHDDIYSAVITTEVIARVHLVNVDYNKNGICHPPNKHIIYRLLFTDGCCSWWDVVISYSDRTFYIFKFNHHSQFILPEACQRQEGD